MPTASIRSREPGTSRAAVSAKAAEEGSPGTPMGAPRSSGWPCRRMIRPAPAGSTSTIAPKWRSMFSLWSRVAWGSSTVVWPRALRPASRMADFTWAEATGRRYASGRALPVPSTVSGRRPPARAEKRAPDSVSGSITRRIGRRRRLASPVMTAVRGWLASTPHSRRAAVPLLPMSRMSSGSHRPPMPRPWMIQSAPSRVISAPSARMAAAVRRTSSPSSRPVMRVSPTARPANMRARWLMDLSPGTWIVPCSGPGARATRIGRGWSGGMAGV